MVNAKANAKSTLVLLSATMLLYCLLRIPFFMRAKTECFWVKCAYSRLDNILLDVHFSALNFPKEKQVLFHNMYGEDVACPEAKLV